MPVKMYVGVTDFDWFKTIKQANCDEVNFWKPGGRTNFLALAEGDLLAIMSAGAYGMSMSSNYNTRPRAAEVMVDGDQFTVIRQREKVQDLFALETIVK